MGLGGIHLFFPVGLTLPSCLEGSLNVASDMFITCICSLVTMWIGPIINFDMQYYTNLVCCTKELRQGGLYSLC